MLQQGRIRLVLTGSLSGNDEIGEHHRHHGDGVHKIALSVPDATAAYEHAVAHGARGVETPHTIEDEHGSVTLSAIATYGERSTCSWSAAGTTGHSSPASWPVTRSPASRCSPRSTTWWATSSWAR